MSSKDRLELRRFMETNPGIHPDMRAYFTAVNRDLKANNIFSTTTTTSTSSTTSTTSTTSSTTSTTSSTTSTTSTTSSTSSTTTTTA